jgi:hypothetical protein
MTDRFISGPNPPEDDERELAVLAERLERARPVPAASFRGDLRRRLLSPGRRAGATTAAVGNFRLWATGYSVAGALCLVVAAGGLVGLGPFAT